MGKHKMIKARILSLVMAAVVGTSFLPASVFAAQGDAAVDSSGISECHPAHDEDCGYLDAVQGIPCAHFNEDGSYSCAPDRDSGMADQMDTVAYVCPHNDGCGYSPDMAETSCSHRCALCAVNDSGNPPAKGEQELTVPCKDMQASSALLDRLLQLLADQQILLGTSDANVTDGETWIALAKEIDALYAHVDICFICAAQMAEGGAYYEKFYGIATLANPVAKIGNTTYATLQEAFSAVKDGETIVVQQDIEIKWDNSDPEKRIGLKNSTLTKNNLVTLDLNGYTVKMDTYREDCIATESSLTILNGTLTLNTLHDQLAGWWIARCIISGGRLTLSNVKIDAISDANSTQQRPDMSAIVAGVPIDSTSYNWYGGEALTIVDSEIHVATKGKATANVRTILSAGDISITGSTLDVTAGDCRDSLGKAGDSEAIHIPNQQDCGTNGTCTINDSTVTVKSGKAAKDSSGINGGNLVIKNSAVTATSDEGDYTYGILVNQLTLEDAQIITNGGTGIASTCGIHAMGDMCVTGATSKITATAGDTNAVGGSSVAVSAKIIDLKDGTITGYGGKAPAGQSVGVKAYQNMTIENGTVTAHGNDAEKSYGISGNSGDIAVSGSASKVTAIAGLATAESYGVVMNPSYKLIISTGTVKAETTTAYGEKHMATKYQPQNENDSLLLPKEEVSGNPDGWKRISATYEVTSQITIGAQSSPLTYGIGDSTYFAVTGNGFGAAYAPVVQWKSGASWKSAAPAGMTATLDGSGNKRTLNISTSATANAGDYSFRITSGAIQAEAKLTVGQAEYDVKTVSAFVMGDIENAHATALLPVVAGSTYGTVTIADNTAGLITVATTPVVTGTTLTMNIASKAAGTTATLTIPVTGTNYKDFTMTVIVTATAKETVTISGLTAATDLLYDGQPQIGYTGTISVEDGKVPVNELVYTYTSTDGDSYNSSVVPTNAGAYKLVVSVAANNPNYTGAHQDIAFTIAKKDISVKVDNQSMRKGETLPAFTVSYTGFVGNENKNNAALQTPAVATCSADGTAVGIFEIIIGTPAVLNTGVGANYTINSQLKGTLTVIEQLYAVTVNGGGTGAGDYAPGATVSIDAGSKSDYSFSGWTSSEVVFANASSASTTFTMPSNSVSVTSNWSYIGGGNGGGSPPSGNSSSTPAIKPTKPVTGNSSTTTTVDQSGNITATVTDKSITDAIKSAKAEAARKGVTAGEITALINVTAPAGGNTDTVTVNLSKAMQEQVIRNTADHVTMVEIVIDNPDISIGMPLAVVAEMHKQANADIQLSVTRADTANLSTEAKNAIGNRPVFNFKAKYDSDTKSITDFGTDKIRVAIPYTLQKGETAGGLYAVYVNEDEKASYLTNSSYDANTKMLRFTTNHFSLYGIGYKVPAGYTDITTHWAKTDIEFAVGRGLITDSSNTTFSPDGAITRAVFFTALGKLADVDVNRYKTNTFTDVKTSAYYAPYANWAVSEGVIDGKTVAAFAPDQSITRQEVAVIMSNYAKAIGYKVPETRAAETFTDHDSIANWAASAVKQMQMAGILCGKDGKQFDPAGTATRGEIAAMFHRYVELGMDSTTSEGWKTNDSGSFLYYKYGKIITGTQTIGGVAYSFNKYGETTRKTATAGAAIINPALVIAGKQYHYGIMAARFGCFRVSKP